MLKYYFCYLFIYLLLAKGLHQKEGAVSSIAVQRWSPLWTVYQFQKIRIRDNENKMACGCVAPVESGRQLTK